MIYAYGCLSTAKIPLSNNTEQVQKTGSYKRLIEELSYLNIHDYQEHIYFDIVQGSYKKRRKLIELLDMLGSNDCILIKDIVSLGTTKEEIAKNYRAIYDKKIGLFIPDEERTKAPAPLSTCDMFLVFDESTDINEKMSFISQIDKIKTKQGRTKKDADPDFVKVYWLYQNFFIKDTDAYDNLLFKMDRKTFQKIGKEYEQTPEYLEALEEQEKLYHISEKPQRYGRPPEIFSDLQESVKSGKVSTLDQAINLAPKGQINDIDLMRYTLKILNGKKGLAAALAKYSSTEEAEELTKGIIKI